MAFLLIIIVVLLGVLAMFWQRQQKLKREAYIRSFVLPSGLFAKLQRKHPQLSLKDCQLVARGLRKYFLTHLKSRHGEVAMPSQVVDDLWHEFILYTKAYQSFCEQAFGKFFHHTPAAVLKSSAQSNAGLRRCWWYACLDENINPKHPLRLPLLFALDDKLKIKDGFVYAANCEAFKMDPEKRADGAVVYCGGDFSNTSVDGSTDGFGDAATSSASDGGDGGGGDGGGGCGGGGD